MIVMLSFCAHAGSIGVPAIPDGETRSYRVYYENLGNPKKKRPLYRRVQLKEAPERIESSYHWVGGGKDKHLEFHRQDILKGGARTDYKFVFKPGKELVLGHFERTLTIAGGDKLRDEMYNVSHPVQKYPDQLFHPYVLETAYRGMELEPGQEKDLYIWAAPKNIVRITVKADKIETVKTKAGEFECLRMEMTPNLDDFLGEIAGPIFASLLPDYVFWMSTSAPHVLVKFRGPLEDMNALTAPIQIYELVSLTEGVVIKP